jgi:hypothetical protein
MEKSERKHIGNKVSYHQKTIFRAAILDFEHHFEFKNTGSMEHALFGIKETSKNRMTKYLLFTENSSVYFFAAILDLWHHFCFE